MINVWIVVPVVLVLYLSESTPVNFWRFQWRLLVLGFCRHQLPRNAVEVPVHSRALGFTRARRTAVHVGLVAAILNRLPR